MQNIFRRANLHPTKLVGLIGLAIFIFGFIVFTPYTLQAGEENKCAECHDEVAAKFKTNPHAGLENCGNCHGDAAKHMQDGGKETIFSFAETDTANAKSSKCMSCHNSTGARYFAGSHGKASMACTDCHNVHKKGMKTHGSKSCHACHQDVFASFKLNERHRLQEGILSCVDCHNPHEPAARERLGGFKDLACLKCHTDKGGPFIHEHGASLIEGCSACHEVHGSPNRHMLTFQGCGDLCFSCHTTSPSWHSRFRSSTNCVTCHSAIHGSNFDELFLK